MKEILEQNVVIFFSLIIFGGLLWGIIGLGQLQGKNWNVINLLFKSNPRIEGVLYCFIGLGTILKTAYNIIWENPSDPPHVVFILLVVVVSGLYWGLIGIKKVLNLKSTIKIFTGSNTTSVGIIKYTIGIFSIFKLLNYILK